MADSNPCGCFLSLISLGFLIAIIVLSAKIYNATEKDPIVEYNNQQPSTNSSLDIEEILKEEFNRQYNYGKHCQCGEEIVNDLCTEEQIIKGCFDVSLNQDKLLRNLGECDIVKEIEDKGGVFKAVVLNFDMVHKMTLGILIVNAIVLGSLFLIMFVACGGAICSSAVALCLPCMCCVFIALIFSGLTHLILLIILMVNYYQGITNGDLLDYYDCENKFAHWDAFNMEQLRSIDSNMTALVVLSFISIFINCITSCLNKESDSK